MSNKKEDIYDKEISPLIKQIIKKCQEHSIPLFAQFELDDDLFCTTSVLPKGENIHKGMLHINALSQCFCGKGIDIDKYLNFVVKNVQEERCHNSIYLARLGYNRDTGEYDYRLSRAITLGSKPDNF